MHILDPTSELPEDAPGWTPDGAIPNHVRNCNRFFHTDNWWPGDVLLLKCKAPNFSQKQIQAFQARGGYSTEDASWTHAAIYMGESLSVCEATVPGWKIWDGKVMVSDLYNYVGKHCVRVCRPSDISDRETGWRIVVHALRQLGKPYDIRRITDFAKSILTKGNHGFWSNGLTRRISTHAVICSTLYADAYTAVTGKTIGEKTNGICVPAFLSQCRQINDVPIKWARLVQAHRENPEQPGK